MRIFNGEEYDNREHMPGTAIRKSREGAAFLESNSKVAAEINFYLLSIDFYDNTSGCVSVNFSL
jgi:hypothetical protein